MARTYHSFISVVLLCSLLAGCGFHLRKNTLPLNTTYPAIILPFSGSHTFHQMLRRTLLTHSVVVLKTTPSISSAPILCVVTEERSDQPIVYGPDSELRRERLFLTMTFSFGYTTPKQFVLSAVRDHQLYSTQHLGDNAEKKLLENEMQKDIIEQLLRYIESESFT